MGTKSGPPSVVTAATKSRIAALPAPSFQDGSGSAAAWPTWNRHRTATTISRRQDKQEKPDMPRPSPVKWIEQTGPGKQMFWVPGIDILGPLQLGPQCRSTV